LESVWRKIFERAYGKTRKNQATTIEHPRHLPAAESAQEEHVDESDARCKAFYFLMLTVVGFAVMGYEFWGCCQWPTLTPAT
jgi:hypothetical protein